MTRMYIRSRTAAAVLAAALALGPFATAHAAQGPARSPSQAAAPGAGCNPGQQPSRTAQPGRTGFQGDEPDFNRASGQNCNSQSAPARAQNPIPGVRLPRLPGS